MMRRNFIHPTAKTGHCAGVAVARAAILALGFSSVAPLSAQAADGPKLVPLKTAPISTTQGLSYNLSGSANGPAPILSPSGMPTLQFDFDPSASDLSAVQSRGKGLFDYNSSAQTCRGADQNCLSSGAMLDVGFSKSISKKNPKGLDVELVPSAAVRFDGTEQSALVGAVVRIGDDLRSKDVASNTWYVFAGADAEALAYSPDRATRGLTSDFILQDRIIIGDAQAGIGYRMGDADVSLGYIRREISSFNDNPGTTGFSSSEDAAALSFTWKR